MKFFHSFCFLIFSCFVCAQDNVVIDRYPHSQLFGSVNEVLIDKGNTKWIASDKGVYTLSDFDQMANKKSDQRALCLTDNNRGDVWAAFANGSVMQMNGEGKIELKDKTAKIHQIKLIKSKMWIGTNKGLFLYNTKTQKLSKSFTTENSKIKSNHINFIHQDIYEIVWVGTNKGVIRFKNESFRKPLNGAEIFKVISEKDDERWMVTDSDIHLVFDENRWNSMGLKEDLHQGKINDMVIDGLGNVFIASDKLVKLDPYNAVIETYTDDLGLLSKECLSLASDAYNHLYIGTGDAGLFRLRFSETELETLSATCFLNKAVSCFGAKDAALKVITSGGTPPYRYKWSDRKLKGKNPQNIGAGTYTVTVTDKNKIEFEIEVTFEEPDPIKIELVEATGVSSPNSRDGYIKINAFGGKGDLRYLWSNKKEGKELKRLSAKEYTVTVSDANGCSAQETFDVPREKFIPELDISKISVGQTLRINNLYFDADSSVITQQSFAVLDEVYDFLDANKNVIIEIGGHTNNNPTTAYADKLSSNRAQNVAIYLFEKGISKNRISFKGYGKRNPIATNASLKGRQKNQRVEIKILSID